MPGLGGLGFFAGGAAAGYDQASQSASLNNYRTQELKIQQQAQQNAEKRQQFEQVQKIENDYWKTIGTYVEQAKIANPNMSNQDLLKPIQPTLDALGKLKTSSGQENDVTARMAALLATPSAATTEAILSRAKDPYKQQKEQADIENLQSQTAFNRQFTGGGTGAPQSDAAPGGPQSTNIPGAGMTLDPKDPGDQFLATVPEGLRQQVKDLAEYRLDPSTLPNRTVKGMSSSVRQVMLGMAEKYAAAKGEPYDQKEYQIRKAAGMAEPKADTAALTALTKSREAIQAFSDTTIANGEVLVGLAKKVDTTGMPVFERWIRAGRQSIEGDADVSNFNFQYNMWRTDAARVIQNPNLTGQLTDNAKAELTAAASPNANLQQIEGAVKLAKGDAARRLTGLDDALSRVRSRLKDERTGKKSSSGPSDVSKMSDDEVLKGLGVK